MTLFQYVPHPHVAARKATGPTRTVDVRRIHHENPLVRFNARLALGITLVVGTMWCAYAFGAIAFVSLPSNIHSTQLFILWLSSSFLQLVLLPIIIVGQNVQARASDKRAEDTYKDAEAVLHEASQIQQHLSSQDQAIEHILARLGTLAPPAADRAPGTAGT